MVVGAYGNALLAAYVPILTGRAFDLVQSGAADIGSRLLSIALLLGGSQVLRSGLQFGRNFGAEVIAQRVERDVRDELYVSLLGKSMTFHSLQPVGDTMARATNDVREVNFLFSPGREPCCWLSPFSGHAAGSCFALSLVAGPDAFALYRALLLRLRHYLKKMQPITDEIRAAFGTMNTHLSEALDGIEVMKGAAQEETEIKRFEANARRVRAANVRQGDLEARFVPLLMMAVALGVGLFHSILLYRNGMLSAGDVVAYMGLLLMLDFPTWTSIWAYSQISLGLAGARRILELMNRENNLDQNEAGYAGTMRGEVEFRDVCFHYQEGEPTLEHVSFKVSPGQTVAIVGQTGAGKTSLIKLINRTYDVTCGQVLVDGVDLRDWNLAALRKQISIIEQDIFLFSRSIAENIAFGKPDATPEEIEAAARAAQADEFINAFEKKYDTVVGERGVTLSGGQRQRLALARAFLTDPRILILDDSTSAIDSATEDRIQRAIAAAAKGRTTFLITHRLSQIRWADLIIVLRKGRVVAMGRHEELMRTSPAYARIFRE
jgi:ABC-type multidrug transport system, ATPase and permease components